MTSKFTRAIEAARNAAKSPLIGAIILGSSGAGKSRALGTFGVPTLYLYTTGEDHGVKSAAVSSGDNLIPICIDYDDSPDILPQRRKLSPDESYKRLLEILNDAPTLIQEYGIKAICIDGASELESIIRSTDAFQSQCLTTQGKHNTFAEPAATVRMFRPIIATLKDLQRQYSVHFAVSCILDVKALGSNGEILEASPRLAGFSVAESIVQQFGDVLVVGRMERNGEVKYKFQFMTEVVKASKDADGQLKKTINFSPRISGGSLETLPAILPADLKEIIALKQQ